MTRSFRSFAFVSAIVTVILLGAGAMPASAQTGTPTLASSGSPPPLSAQQGSFAYPVNRSGTPGAPVRVFAVQDATGTAGADKYPEVQEAFELFSKDHKMPEAIKKLEEAAQKYPELPSAHVLMYQFLLRADPPAARAQLDDAIKSSPSDPEPYIILGSIALKERRVDEATKDLEKARQLLAAYTNAARKGTLQQQTLSGLALMAEARQDWKEAETLLRELLEIAPADLVAHQRLARCLFWQGNYHDSFYLLIEAKRIDADNARKNRTREVFLTPEVIMGQYYEQFEGPKSTTGHAEKWFRAAVKVAPDDLPTHQVVALWALEKGNIAFAKEQAEAILRIEAEDNKLPDQDRKYPGSLVGRVLHGVDALWEKEWLEAEKDFQKILDHRPTDFVARNNIALALVEQKDPAKLRRALAYAEANYRDNPKSPDSLSTLGWVYFRRGEFEQARSALEKSVKASGGNLDPDTATYLAHVLYHQDRKSEAKDLLERVLKDGRPFAMQPEAKELYEKVKDVQKPE